jgi:integrase
MRGTVYQLDSGSWRAQVDLPSPEGDRKRISETFETKREADQWANEIAKAIRTHGQVPDTDSTLEEFIWDWYEKHAVRNLKKTTYKRYESLIRCHIVPELGDMPLKAITTQILEDFYWEREENGDLNGDGGLAANTVRQMHAILRKALNDGVRWDKLAENPADKAKPPSADSSHTMQTLTSREARRLIEVAKDVSAYTPLYDVAVTMGMRRGEILGLPWEHVDLENGQIRIEQTWNLATGGEHHFGTPKSDESRRTLGLTDRLTFRLKRLRQEQQDQKKKLGPAWEDHDLVFCSNKGTPLDTTNIPRDFKKVKEEADLPDIRFHDLRHTCATLMLENGEHPKTVSHKLGHSSIQVTLDTYSHVSTDLQQKASQALEDQIFEDEDDDNLQATG